MLAALKAVSLFLVGFTLPLQGYSFLDFRFGMTPFKVSVVILAGVAVIELVIRRRGLPHDRKRWWLVAFLMTTIIACVTGLGYGVPPVGVAIVASTHVSIIVYYFLIGYVVREPRDLLLVLWSLLLGGAVAAVPAALGLEQGIFIQHGERFAGLGGQVNLFGFDMALCLAVGMALFFGMRALPVRSVALGLSLLCVVGLVLSLSRSAFVSLAVMGAAWTMRSARVGNVKYLAPAIAIAAGLALAMPESVVERVDSMLDADQRAEDGSIQSRFVQMRLGARALAESPLVGLGVLRFVPWSQKQPGGYGNDYEIHNAYLGVAVEQGLPGAVLYLALLLVTWWDYSACIRQARARRRLGDPSLAQLGHLATFLQIALLGTMVGGVFGMVQWSKTMWLVLALSPVLLTLCGARVRELERRQPADAGFDALGFRFADNPFWR